MRVSKTHIIFTNLNYFIINAMVIALFDLNYFFWIEMISFFRNDYSCPLDLSDNKHCGKVQLLENNSSICVA